MKKFVLILGVLAAFWASQVMASTIDDLTDALKSGKVSMQLRLGYEHSNLQDNGKHPANGINLRTRLGYRTADFYNSNVFIQFHNVTNFMEEFSYKHDGKLEGDKANDVIADPDGSRIHQVYLDYKGLSDTVIRLGRQEIILDDHRLIGNINWRQNGQSFDAASITNKSIPGLTLFGSYVENVNTILLDDLDLTAMYLLHAKYTGFKGHAISAFCYLLDAEQDVRDSATYGARAAGKVAVLKYAIDFAHQSDFSDGDDHDGNMFNAFLGGDLGMFSVGAGFSWISGQDGSDLPFDTLFSTAHKFNGWSDQFLATNGGKLRDGLKDYYAQAAIKYMGIKFMAVYHYFDTSEDDHFDGTYGDEIDLLIAKKFTKNLSGLLKYANYNKDDNFENGFANPTKDEQVFWARLQFSF